MHCVSFTICTIGCLLTFSSELVLSLLLSSRLFPESVEIREPLESAW